MGLFSNRDDIDPVEIFASSDFTSLLDGLVSASVEQGVWEIGGTNFEQAFVVKYFDASMYDAESDNPDASMHADGWNRQFVLFGSDLTFDENGVPVLGEIEALGVLNAEDELLYGAYDIVGLDASVFQNAWISEDTTDDEAFFSSVVDLAEESDSLEGGEEDTPDAGDDLGGEDDPDGEEDLDGENDPDGDDDPEEEDDPDEDDEGAAVIGSRDDDTLDGTSSGETINGKRGSDILNGLEGRDVLIGGAGKDSLNGGEGRDILKGGKGSDTLDGGFGDDKLNGGRGDDTFVFSGGADIVVGFRDGDVVDMTNATGIDSFEDLLENHVSGRGRTVVIEDDLADTMTLKGLRINELDADDFLF
ncbi:hypothetical protein PXK58_08630 [Phaeobacter gallaeciensis]|uniref:calcium-binding protein n=1 Tax=Phaeobacter gallaeciensis TaxID=60890 RepID=UPI002380A62A|nr:hypothetical protein [Phaeobacter gallaeciensis]MDE4274376.1 hypothetical protein [Phaeobacter gallaeciensis]MDE4299616.1 hypothetical protein [Phaeobacter gallaeciensis]MDE5184780.1 hypothetical protein [Phaeobacter gallaeciensis]